MYRQATSDRAGGQAGPDLRLRQHVQVPGAHLPVCRDGDEVVSVRRAHHVQAVNWVGVASAGERGALDGSSLAAA